jgi:acetylglutamate kinase
MKGATCVVTRIVKLGGRAQGDAALPATLVQCWRDARAAGGALVIVHGGGDAISALQRARGETPLFIGGRRVTTDSDIDVIRMALSGITNKQLVAALTAAGAPSVGLSGEDGALIRARPSDDAETMGRVGTPTAVNAALLELLATAGYLPVLSPLACDETSSTGAALNVNGDDAAAAIAIAVGAAELFFMADVPGVLDDAKEVVPVLTIADSEQLIATGVAAGGMAAKLEAARDALARGVARVRIGDLAALTDASRGTAIVASVERGAPSVEQRRPAPSLNARH